MADSNAIMLVLGGQSYRNIIIKTRSVLEEVSNVRQSLSNLKVDLKKFNENCNVAKTVGTIHNVFGAGLALDVSVLFTGGISFLLTAGSVVAAMTGLGVNVSTDLINISETAKYIDTITNKFSNLQWRFKEIEADLNQYLESVKKLVESYELSEDVMAYFIHRLETERLRIDAVAGSVTHLKVADEMSMTIKTMKSVSETTTGGKSFVISRSSSVSKGSGPSSINKKSVGGEIFHGIKALIKVCVVVFDIVSMTEDWNTNHPALEVIDDVLAKLYVIENQIRESLSFIECIN